MSIIAQSAANSAPGSGVAVPSPLLSDAQGRYLQMSERLGLPLPGDGVSVGPWPSPAHVGAGLGRVMPLLPPGSGGASVGPWPLPFQGGTSGSLPGTPSDGSGAFGSGSAGGQGGFLGFLNGLINQLGALINASTGEAAAEGPATQTVSDGTFASTGDPHLSEVGTLLGASGAGSSVDSHFDSMSSHDNLLSSQDFNGGYRLSTAVTAPNANGVTMNASATVHMNSNTDLITMRNDGSFSVSSGGNSVALGAGQSVTLVGGEQVTSNPDGSLTVAAQNAYGGTISTTLAAKGGGVDASATVHAASVGGDIAGGLATNGAPPVQPVVQAPPATTYG